MNIHIALVGPLEAIKNGIRIYAAVDKMYLLYSKTSEHSIEAIKEKLQVFQLQGVICEEVRSFDFYSVFNTIIKIARKESQNKECHFFINITGGPKIMPVAATLAGYIIGAQTYYLMKPQDLAEDSSIAETRLELPMKNIFYPNPVKSIQFKILQLINEKKGRGGVEGEDISQKEITKETGEKPQVISYNIKQLNRNGLISVSIDKEDSRKKYISITNPGKLALTISSDIIIKR